MPSQRHRESEDQGGDDDQQCHQDGDERTIQQGSDRLCYDRPVKLHGLQTGDGDIAGVERVALQDSQHDSVVAEFSEGT
ncbi:hypothetical protein MMUR_28850 [Mycolicibacterium murale]|uniref:Uncharacterized protein n=1 Tax=Mycolicibacterium murale TaxID=182220 RepID=A0A7I9WME0_9MYCO|nr:hypothetical protein MMUR_28850 [Mycolicibacterium murale]